MMTILCPCCGYKAAIQDSLRGQRVNCPNCGTPILVSGNPPPPPAKKPEPPQAQSTPRPPTSPSRVASRRPAQAPPPEDPIFVPTADPKPRKKSRSGCLSCLVGCLGLFLVLIVGGGAGVYFLLPSWLERAREQLEEMAKSSVPPDTQIKSESTEKKKTAMSDPEWVDAAKSSIRLGDIRVSVSGAAVDVVKGTDNSGEFVSDQKHLMVRLRLENTGANGVPYKGWGVAEGNREEVPRLLDDRGNLLKRVTFGEGTKVHGQIRSEVVAPGKALDDLLVFEAPATTSPTLKLELPARNFGGSGKLGFAVPRSLIASSGSAPAPAPPPSTPPKPKSVVELARLLTDADVKIRRETVEELGRRGPAAALAVKPLGTVLATDADAGVREAAAVALGKIGPLAHPAFGTLVRGLGDAAEPVRKASQAALPLVGPPERDDVVGLREALAHPNPAARRFAVQTLARLKLDGATAAPIYADALRDSERDIRLTAVQALGRIDPKGRLAIWPILIGALKDSDKEVQTAAAAGLKALGAPGAAEVAVLQRSLRDPSPEIRQYALAALADAGPVAKAAIPDLIDVLKHPDVPTRRAAALALGKQGPGAGDAVQALQEALRDSDKEVRLHTVTALGSLGAAGRAASGELARAIRDEDAGVRKAATKALRQVAPETMLDAQRKALLDRSDAIRLDAAEYMAGLGAEAKPAYADLIIALQESNRTILNKVARSLAQVNPESTAPVKAITELLADTDAEHRKYAAETCTLLSPSNLVNLVPSLTKGLKDTEIEVRQSAAVSLTNMGSDARKAVPDLVESMDDKRMHEAARTALIKIGKPSLAGLGTGLGHKNANVRLGCAIALGKFGPGAQEQMKAIGDAIYAEKDKEVLDALKETLDGLRKK